MSTTVLSISRIRRSADYLEEVGLLPSARFLRIAAHRATEGIPIAGEDRSTVLRLCDRAAGGYEAMSPEGKALIGVDPR